MSGPDDVSEIVNCDQNVKINSLLLVCPAMQCNLTKSSFQCLRYLMQLDAMLTPGSEKLSANCTSG